MNIGYGPENRVQSFAANAVRTRTDPTADDAQAQSEARWRRSPPAARCPRSSTEDRGCQSMEQAGDFTSTRAPESPCRKATPDAQDVMFSRDRRESLDSTGATSADRIRIDHEQETGRSERRPFQ
jgi:hypothetical protein